MKWSCSGSVRGSCGITHGSFAAAWKCCQKDHRSVTKGQRGGSLTHSYSDRAPYPVDGWDDAAESEQADFLATRW